MCSAPAPRIPLRSALRWPRLASRNPSQFGRCLPPAYPRGGYSHDPAIARHRRHLWRCPIRSWRVVNSSAGRSYYARPRCRRSSRIGERNEAGKTRPGRNHRIQERRLRSGRSGCGRTPACCASRSCILTVNGAALSARPALVQAYHDPRSLGNDGSRENYRGFMYQKIASATRATVMIHRTMSLLRFFSSAIDAVQHTSILGSSAALISRG